MGKQSGNRASQGIMEDNIAQKSCWGVTAKAVLGVVGILLLTWLVRGAETAAVLASAS